MAFKFYAETENAIIRGIDEHKVYQFLIQRQHGYFMLDHALPAYWAELWKLKDRNHEGKEDYEEDPKGEEKKDYEENQEAEEDQDVEDNLK